MALIDKLRFHSILTRGGIPEAPSIDFADALQETFEDQLAPLAPKSELERILLRIDNRFAQIENRFAQAERDDAEREARQSRQFLVGIAIILAALTLATGLIIAFT